MLKNDNQQHTLNDRLYLWNIMPPSTSIFHWVHSNVNTCKIRLIFCCFYNNCNKNCLHCGSSSVSQCPHRSMVHRHSTRTWCLDAPVSSHIRPLEVHSAYWKPHCHLKLQGHFIYQYKGKILLNLYNKIELDTGCVIIWKGLFHLWLYACWINGTKKLWSSKITRGATVTRCTPVVAFCCKGLY